MKLLLLEEHTSKSNLLYNSLKGQKLSNLTPVSTEKFQSRYWFKYSDFGFTASDTLVPISANEVPQACIGLPLGFLLNKDVYSCVALLGLNPGQNLCLDKDNLWSARYLPHHYLFYPFVALPNTDGNLVLCVDENSNLIHSDSSRGGEPFFDSSGAPNPKINEIFKFLHTKATQHETTLKICDILAEHNLLKPWTVNVPVYQTQFEIDDLFCIDESRLNQLPGSALRELRNTGALLVAYAQLFSMANTASLARILYSDGGSAKKSLGSELGFSTEKDSGSLNFDNL